MKEARALAAHPAKTAKIGAGVAGELAWLLLMPEDSWTRFKGKPSGNKRVAWTAPIPLDEVKVAGKALGCTINDVLLASVAGALYQYLKEKGDPTNGVEVRALVPVDLRKSYEAGQLGNRFGIVGVELPVGIENPLKRLFEVHRRMQALKQSLEPPVTLGMFAILGYAPQMVQDRLFDMLIHRATAVMTNVPGPTTPLYLGGAEIKQVMFWVPQSGDIGMGVSILTYNGMVQFGLVTDAAMVPDPEAIIAHFRPQFDQLLYHVLMSPWGQADTKAAEQAALQAGEAHRARKSKPVSPPRKKPAKTKSAQATPEPKSEALAPKTRKARPASQARAKGAQAKSDAQAITPAAPEQSSEASAVKVRKSRGTSKTRMKDAEAILQAEPGPGSEAPVAEVRRSRRAQPRAKRAGTGSDGQAVTSAAPEPSGETKVVPRRKSRSASQPRTRSPQANSAAQAISAAAPEPRITARRKLPRK